MLPQFFVVHAAVVRSRVLIEWSALDGSGSSLSPGGKHGCELPPVQSQYEKHEFSTRSPKPPVRITGSVSEPKKVQL